MERHLVVFGLGKENYGVDISAVEAIIKMQPITVVPHTPHYVEGVTNLRGSVLPVIDLRKRFGLELDDISKNSRIVVIVLGKTKVGMIVDGVSEVLQVPEDAIEPTPSMITSVDTTFITGIAKLENKLVILLDLSKVLSLQEVLALQS